MSEIKTRGEMLDYITGCAKDYRLECKESIIRNSHMNELDESDFDIDQKYIDAILVDFVNYIGAEQCLDWGLYTKDLKD
jgi:hypothetical protein